MDDKQLKPYGEGFPIPPGECTAPDCECEPGSCFQRVPATFHSVEALRFIDMPKSLQDALLAYHARPCDKEAAGVVRAVLRSYGAAAASNHSEKA